jgi:hypothetical protein
MVKNDRGKGCSFPLQREYDAVPATSVNAFKLIDSDLLLPSVLKIHGLSVQPMGFAQNSLAASTG